MFDLSRIEGGAAEAAAGWIERASISPLGSAPIRRARSRRRTPVQSWVVDQPSTQAIGSSALVCGRASSSSRESRSTTRSSR